MKSFNAITRPLRKVVRKLERLIETNQTKSSEHSSAINSLHDQIGDHNQQIRDLNKESSQADATADKIRALIGEPVTA